MDEDNLQKKVLQILSATLILMLLIICDYTGTANAITSSDTSFRYKSEPGECLGNGVSSSYTTDNARILVTGTTADLTFYVVNIVNDEDWWFIDLSAPVGETLRPGVYYKAERAAFRTGRSPGLDVSGNGRGCIKIWGTFSINQIAANEAGEITVLDASFTQHCESNIAPALSGVVAFNARPLSYAFTSDPGSIGQGAAKNYEGATSTFALGGNDTFLQYDISGKRDYWTAMIEAPTGQHLSIGKYRTARLADANHARLDIYGNGGGCNTSIGTLNIRAITFDAQGNVVGLNANFTQHCEGVNGALHGTIHFYE